MRGVKTRLGIPVVNTFGFKPKLQEKKAWLQVDKNLG